jgi:gliding motility-associated-like protein
VNAGPSISTPPQSQSICIGGTLASLNVAYTGGTGSVSYQWFSNTTNSTIGGTAVGTSSSSYTLPSTLNTSAGTSYYYCELSFGGSGGCSQIITAVATISVVAGPTVNSPTSQTICTGGSPVPLTVSASGGINTSYSYQWYNASGAITTATSASYTPPSSAGDYYCVVSILPTSTGCSVNSTNAIVSVVPDPTVSAPQSANYCQNASSVAALSVTASGGISSSYVYQWYSNANNNTTSGTAISAVNGGTSASYTPPVNATGTVYYYCIVSINPSSTTGCSVTSAIATITVNAGPSISTPPQSQSICIGGTLASLNVAYTGGTGSVSYQWFSNTTNSTIGGTAVGTSSSSYTLPSTLNTSAGTSYYYCELSFGGSGGCSQIITAVATISVVAGPTVNSPTSQTICTGGSPVPLTVSASGGINTSYSYQWYNASGAITTATSASYTPPSSAGDYYCVVSILPTSTGCSVNSTNAIVSVVPDPTVSAPQSANYCQNASSVAALSVTASGGISSSYVYQWYSNANNNTTSGTAISAVNGGTSASYTPPVTATGTVYYYCVVTNAPANSGCSTASNTATIVVTQGPTFLTQPLNQTICIGGTLNALSVTYAGGSGTPSYQWYSNTTAANTGGTLISGAILDTYTLPAGLNNAASTTYYYCVINFGAGSGCSVITSTAATISVLADPTFSVQPIPSQSICEGGSISALTTTIIGGSGTASYQWYTVTSGTYTAITTNGTSATYTPPTFTTAGTYNYAVLITQSVSGCNSTYSANAEVIVVTDPVIVTQPIGASYCQNASPVAALTVSASGGFNTNYTYQWYNGTNPIGSATSSSYTPSVLTNGTSNYSCTIGIAPLSSGCSVNSTAAEIVVTAGPAFVNQPISQTVCLDGSFNTLSVSYSGGSGTPTYQWFSNTTSANTGGTAISNANTSSYIVPTTLSSTVGNNYYYCTINFGAGSGCSLISSTVATLSVINDPTFSVQPIPTQSICEGGSIAALTTTLTGGSGTPTYQWYTVNSGTYSAITTNGTSVTYTPPTFTTAGTFNYALLITQSVSGCASTYSANAEVIVVGDPTVSSPIGASYCQNASPVTALSVSAANGINSNYSYQWYNGTNLINGATTSSYIPSLAAIGTLNYTCTVSILPLTSGCSVTSTPAAITVNPAPTFTTQPIPSQTICLNGTLNQLSVVYQNGTGVPTYQWFSNLANSTSGGTAISGATASTYSPPSNAVGTTYYYCVATFSSGGCTAITSTLGTVVILADPTISSQPIPSQSICVGGTIASALTASATGGTGTTSYQWSNSTGAITGATSQTYLPPSYSNTGQYNYTVTITLSGSGCDAMTSNVALIDVVSDPIVSTQPVGTSYCQNGSPVTPLTVAATGGLGTFSYQWYSNSVNNTTSGSLIPLAASSSYTPPVSTVGTTYYYCVITQTGLNCGVTSNTAAIIVNPAPTFATQPIASQTVCVDGTFNALTVVYQNGTGTPTYQWFSNSTSSTSNGTLLPNETNATYTPPSNTVGTTYYYCVATFASGGCSAITSTLATATVVADPTISIQPIPTQSICVGGTIASALTATSINGTGTVSYQWSNSTGSISGATSQTYLPPAFTTVGAYTFLVTITLSGSGCNAAISQNAVIDVVADPVVSVQPISASYCQNGTPVTPLTVGATGGIGTFSYQWYSSNSNSTTSGTILSGATSSTYTPSVTNIGTIYYYCVISQTGLNCSVTSNTAGIIVNQAPAFLTQPISQTICSGGTFNPLSVTYQFGTGVPSYQWYSNSSNSYTGAVAIAGANTSTYQAPSSSTGSNYYFCVISFSFGGCSNISSSISNQVVVADPSITTEPLLNQTICVGGTITNPLTVVVNGGTGITSYQWYQGTNQINNATQSTFLPGSYLNAGMYNYQVNITSTGVGCDALISQQVSVEVLNDPSITTPTPAIYCQNSATVAPLQVTVSGGAGTNNYQWYYSTTNTNTGGVQIAGASTSSYVPSVSVVGTSYYYCIVTQTTPNCSNVSSNAAIQINQPPTISAQPIPSQTLCEGGTPTVLQVSYINGTNSATYQWYVSNTNSNTGGAPILNETSSTYSPPTIAVGSNYYYCVIIFQSGGCSTLTSATSNVTVVNDPAINVQPLNAQEICQGNTINLPLNFTYSGGTGNSTIAWYLNATPPVLINGVTTSSFLPVPFNVADTFFYYATLSFDGVGCNNVSTQLAEIIVHPTPYALNLNDTIVVCNHGNLAIPLTATVTSTFVWHTTNNPSVTGESFLNQTSYTIDDSLNNNSTNAQFLTYTVTPTSFPYGCVGPDSIVTVQIQPDVILSMNPAMEICSDSPVNAILTSNIPSTFTWFVSVNNPNVTGESIIPSSNSIVNDVLVNTSTSNQVVVYSVFPISILGQCPGLAQPLVVTVKPPIQLLNPDTLTICSGQNTNINLVANTNVQFNWYASPSLNVLNETTNVIPSSLINDVLVNPTNAVETVTYNVIGTSTANGCSSPVLPLYVVVNPIPELQNVNPITICNGAYLYPVSLQTTVTGGTTNWTVLNNNIGIPSTFGSNTLPGFVATNNSIITQTGQVAVTPIFTNNNVTCIGVDTTLYINVLPTPSVNPIADIVACNLEQVPLTPITGPVPNTVYQWVNANTAVGLNVSGIGDIPVFVGQNAGLLPISGSVSISPTYIENNVSCQGTPIDFTITVNPSPTLINNDIEICDGNYTNILLNANISSTFIWNATINQNVYNETTPVQTSAFINDQLTLAGTTAQTVIYNVTPISTPYGCYGNDTTINVLINPLPIVDFTIINPILCDQSLINFQNNSVGPLAYTWAFGDNDSSFLFNPVHEYANFGSYLVTLSAIDQITGCVNQDSQTFIIHETPEPDFILSDSLACGSLDVVFTALDLNPTWQYNWDFGDGASSNQFGLAGHQFVNNGCFDVSLIVTTPEGCTSNSTQLSAVCIYPEPIASFSIDDAVISSLAPEVIFFNTSVHADTYLWDFGDNTTSITQNPTHLYPSDPATYVIILTASNFIGCQDTAALTVTVFQDLAIYVPNTFTPDGDEYNQTFLPILTEGFDPYNYELLIFNRWGELIFQSYDYKVGWDGTYGPNAIPAQFGTYTWKIEVDELQSGDTRKFVGHVNLIK